MNAFSGGMMHRIPHTLTKTIFVPKPRFRFWIFFPFEHSKPTFVSFMAFYA